MKNDINILLNKIQQEFYQNMDIVFSFYINGNVKNIIYDSSTKTLSEPIPDKIDNNQILIIPYLDNKSIKIKIREDRMDYEVLS